MLGAYWNASRTPICFVSCAGRRGTFGSQHELRKDAEFITPDSREGWCRRLRRVLFTRKGLSCATICARGYGETIAGLGGVLSAPLPLINFLGTLRSIFNARAERKLRPIDIDDTRTAAVELVFGGNVKKWAIILVAAWDES
jgi:hypothetical protein